MARLANGAITDIDPNGTVHVGFAGTESHSLVVSRSNLDDCELDHGEAAVASLPSALHMQCGLVVNGTCTLPDALLRLPLNHART